MKNNTSFNVLATFAAIAPSKRFNDTLMELSASGTINLMIDSGAFTKFNAKGSYDFITLDNYCDYLQKYGAAAEKYVMLDVVGNAAQSKANYEIMVQRGLRPMFVATMFDKDFDYIKSTYAINENICVAGGVTTKGPWMIKRFQDVYYKTGEQAKIHGLGYVTMPNMFRLPLTSVDSSSWKSGRRYGNGNIWLGKGRKLQINWQDYLRHGKKLETELKTALDKVCITPQMYFTEKYHRGINGIEQFLTLQYCTEFQHFAKQNNRDLFLACNGAGDVLQLLYVRKNNRALKYEDFYKTKF